MSSPSDPSLNSSAANAPNSLAAIWAEKYVRAIVKRESLNQLQQVETTVDLTTPAERQRTANALLKQLTLASALAWSLTETLLSKEISRHGIDPELINPWMIAADVHELHKQLLRSYAEGVPPQRLSVLLGDESGRVRQKYTADDPRVIGFFSMQLHYTGQKLLERLTPGEKELLVPYLKVMDDHMYMPLRDAYEAAANHAANSPVLIAVQHLLSSSTAIAQSVCEHVRRLHPGLQTYSGLLSSVAVQTSSLRDVEMFQVYLCLCALEGSIRSLQQELFPLCVMLYPPLQVNWQLVQDMLRTLLWEMHDYLKADDMAVFLPYLHDLSEMFSPQVLQYTT